MLPRRSYILYFTKRRITYARGRIALFAAGSQYERVGDAVGLAIQF